MESAQAADRYDQQVAAGHVDAPTRIVSGKPAVFIQGELPGISERQFLPAHPHRQKKTAKGGSGVLPDSRHRQAPALTGAPGRTYPRQLCPSQLSQSGGCSWRTFPLSPPEIGILGTQAERTRAGAAQRREQRRTKTRIKRPGVARIDDLFDPERLRCTRSGDGSDGLFRAQPAAAGSGSCGQLRCGRRLRFPPSSGSRAPLRRRPGIAVVKARRVLVRRPDPATPNGAR